MIFLDTHIVVWLFSGQKDLFSTDALKAFQENDLYISPMVVLELEYLYEIKKIKYTSTAILTQLEKTTGLTVANDDWVKVTNKAAMLKWTRDPFDRLITAHAMIHSAKLLTKDATILKKYKNAIW